MLVGALLCVVLVLLLGVATLRWCATNALEVDLGLPTDDAVTDRHLLLPEGHQPPPGLSPLSPSERFLAAEALRGLRDLEDYLIDAA